MSDDKNRGTRSLVAEAEALRSGKESRHKQGTRGLVRDAEKLIGREPSPGAKPAAGLLGAVVVIAAIAIGLYLWLGS